MTATFDAFLCTNELIAIMTGLPMDRAPLLINRASGASVVCGPTEISGIPGMCASFGPIPCPGRSPRRQDNAWVATLPIEPTATEVGLSIVIGDVVRSAIVRRRPEPEPVPLPPAVAPPKRGRRTRVKPAAPA